MPTPTLEGTVAPLSPLSILRLVKTVEVPMEDGSTGVIRKGELVQASGIEWTYRVEAWHKGEAKALDHAEVELLGLEVGSEVEVVSGSQAHRGGRVVGVQGEGLRVLLDGDDRDVYLGLGQVEAVGA